MKTKKLHIVMAVSEAVPYAKTGGLADVIGALSKALSARGAAITIFLPLYEQIDRNRFSLKSTGHTFDVPVSNRREEAELFTHQREGLTYYFVKKDRYFKRPGLYGTNEGDYPDNAERFVFFSRAVLEAAKALELRADVIHCHDWHTGLIPVYLKTLYASEPLFQKTASLFTIHNLGYQGIFWHHDWPLLNLPWDYFNHDALEFYGKINFLKGGLVFADALSTVSPKYAKEIQTAAYGHRLEGVLAGRKKDLYGILNGIDTEEWDPSRDLYIPFQYHSKNLAGKEKCKAALQKELGLPVDKGIPLLAMITRLTEQKGVDLAAEVFEKVLRQGAQWVILGSGEKRFEALFEALGKKHPRRAFIKVAYDNGLAHRIEAGADIFLMPSRYEPCGLNQMMSLRYGTPPVVRATGGLDDTVTQFDPKTLQGNGFEFKSFTPTAFLRRIQNALSLFREKKRWKALIQNGMGGDYSWNASADKYLKLYYSIVKKREGR
ncbi:MAG TPA: glycogen synthase GlgA [Candidatus Manganitrophaceae bacterium]|nr:glycogen synthase GlgA [Candidatus Manganitrophaceae bacterium]